MPFTFVGFICDKSSVTAVLAVSCAIGSSASQPLATFPSTSYDSPLHDMSHVAALVSSLQVRAAVASSMPGHFVEHVPQWSGLPSVQAELASALVSCVPLSLLG